MGVGRPFWGRGGGGGALCAYLREGVGPGLEDDEADTDGRRDALEREALCDLEGAELLADRLLLRGDGPDARA